MVSIGGIRKHLLINRPHPGPSFGQDNPFELRQNNQVNNTYVFEQLRHMLRRRHPTKSVKWLIKHYWSAAGKNVFAVLGKTAKTGKRLYRVLRVSAIGIRRYVKIKAAANPYLPEYAGYFWRRRHDKESKLLPAMSAREYQAMASA